MTNRGITFPSPEAEAEGVDGGDGDGGDVSQGAGWEESPSELVSSFLLRESSSEYDFSGATSSTTESAKASYCRKA